MSQSDPVQDAIEHNQRELLARGPGLRWDGYRKYVIARRPSTNEVLLGGLGSMGVGEMWFAEANYHREYPGYDSARIAPD